MKMQIFGALWFHIPPHSAGESRFLKTNSKESPYFCHEKAFCDSWKKNPLYYIKYHFNTENIDKLIF